MKYLALFLLLITGSIANAQTFNRDYLININGDTIRAKIRHDMMGKMVYKLSKESSALPIDTLHFKEYFWTQRKPFSFFALSMPDLGKKAFVGILERGKISLYVRKASSNKGSTSYWYATKDNKIFQVNNTRRLFGVD